MQTFTTVGGTVLRLRPVTAFFILQVAMKVEKEWRDKGEPIDPPTYTLRLAAGDEETFPHKVTDEENTLEVEGDPEQTKINKLRWTRHLDAYKRFVDARDGEMRDALLREAVDYDEPEHDGWEKKYGRYGISIPEDDRRFFYLKHELLTATDYLTLSTEVRMLADGKEVTQEQVDSMRQLFRSALGTREWETAEQLLDNLRALVGALQTESSPDGEGLGIDAEPMGRAGFLGQGADDSPGAD